MTKAEAKDLIVKRIDAVQGCKATELAGWAGTIGELRSFDIPLLFEELVQERKIVEVSYVLANMEYLEKSFYLPGNTLIVCHVHESHLARKPSKSID